MRGSRRVPLLKFPPFSYAWHLSLSPSPSLSHPQLFAEDVRYFLPAYQRNYCWREEKAHSFLQPLLDRVVDGHDELRTSAVGAAPGGPAGPLPTDSIRAWTAEQVPESIGFIVLYRGAEDGEFGVIDGQQRMVTLSFIFAALRECFLGSGLADAAACADEMHDRIWQRPHLSRGMPATARLTVRSIDVDMYRKLCLIPGRMQALLDRAADEADEVLCSESHEKMLCAQRIIFDMLKGQPPDVWRLLAAYLPECNYNMLLSRDANTALKMFGSLNFKGAEQMGAVDRFRSAIVMQDEADLNDKATMAARASASEGRGGALTRLGSQLEPVWDELQTVYGRSFIAAAVLRAIQCRLGLLERKSAYWQDPCSLSLADKYDSEAQLQLAEAEVAAAEYFGVPLLRLLQHYRVVDEAALPAGAQGHTISRLLQSLKVCALVEWEPVVLAFLRPRLDEDGLPISPKAVSETEDFLARLDRFVFFVMVVEGGVNRLERINAVLQAVTGGADPHKLMLLGSKSLEKLRAALSCPRLGGRQPAVVKAVLLRADAALRAAAAGEGGGGTVSFPTPAWDSTSWSVEHVLPGKPKASGPWARTFPDEAARKAQVNLLGNLALLSPAANSSAGNVGFVQKKAKYRRVLGEAMPAITAEVVAAEVWDADTIAARHERLVQLLLQPYWDAARLGG